MVAGRKRRQSKQLRTARLVERARIRAILYHPAAACDPHLAFELAFNSTLSASTVITALEASAADNFEHLDAGSPTDEMTLQIAHTLH